MVIGVKLRTLDGFPIDDLLRKNGTLKATGGSSNRSYQIGLDLVAANPDKVNKLRTHVFGFNHLDRAIEVLSGKAQDENAINVVVQPTFL